MPENFVLALSGDFGYSEKLNRILKTLVRCLPYPRSEFTDFALDAMAQRFAKERPTKSHWN
jgi:hypothetical protein